MLLRRGLALLESGKDDQAIASFNVVIARNPKDAEALTKRGRAWASKKEYDKAIADYSAAIRLDPSDPRSGLLARMPGKGSGNSTRRSPIATKPFA